MTPPDSTISAVIARLRSRRTDLERAILMRVREIVSKRPRPEDPEYAFGLRAAIGSIVECALMDATQEESSEPIPSAAIAQARRAARVGIGLDTVLRRYLAGYALVWDFVMEEATRSGVLDHADLRRLQVSHTSLLDRLIVAVAHEYNRESARRVGRSPARRREEVVLKLLAREYADPAELGYEVEAWHVGVVATGKNAGRAVRDLAAALDRELLNVSRGDETAWAWLGGRRRLAGSDIARRLPTLWPAGVSLAIGEPGKGLDGWRMTHGQAQATLRVVLHKPQKVTRYVDVALLAAVLDDPILARSLVQLYLSPLRAGGSELLTTLHTYFATGRSVTRTARSLKVVRQTIENRLRAAEQVIGEPLQGRLAALEIALLLNDLPES